MYARQAHKNEEAFILDRIEENNLDKDGFRSRDYIVVVDEDAENPLGFGRYRVHTTTSEEAEMEEIFEITSLFVGDTEDVDGVWTTLLEGLAEEAIEREIEMVYSFVPHNPELFIENGFEQTDQSELPEVLKTRYTLKEEHLGKEVTPVVTPVEEFVEEEEEEDEEPSVKEEGEDLTDDEVEEYAEEIGVNPDQKDYKYQTSL